MTDNQMLLEQYHSGNLLWIVLIVLALVIIFNKTVHRYFLDCVIVISSSVVYPFVWLKMRVSYKKFINEILE